LKDYKQEKRNKAYRRKLEDIRELIDLKKIKRVTNSWIDWMFNMNTLRYLETTDSEVSRYFKCKSSFSPRRIAVVG